MMTDTHAFLTAKRMKRCLRRHARAEAARVTRKAIYTRLMTSHVAMYDAKLLAQRPDDEWLLTNGLGGFASGTVYGVPRRRYHAWLIAAMSPPVGRMVMLSACAEWLVVAGKAGEAPVRYALASFAFGAERRGQSAGIAEGARGETEPTNIAGKTAGAGAQSSAPTRAAMLEVVSPRGIDGLRACSVGSTVTWEYELAGLHERGKEDGSVRITRELCLHRLRNACSVRYKVSGVLPAGSYLESRPLFAMRDFHDLAQHDRASMHLEQDGKAVRVSRGMLACVVHAEQVEKSEKTNCVDGSARFVEGVDVWSNFAYSFDRERGQDGREHLWSPGTFVVPLKAGTHARAVALELSCRAETDASLTGVRTLPSIEDHLDSEEARLAPMIAAARSGGASSRDVGGDAAAIAALVRAADQFVVVRGPAAEATVKGQQSSTALTSIIAGYPWFSDWGRDTMISLPGLLLACGRFDEAHASLLAFARLRRKGLVPNCFDNSSGEAMYNTADASLWFLIACSRYWKATGDAKGFAALIPACYDVVEAYEAGTDYGIRVDKKDGLVVAGNRDTQLTWMDAKRDGVVFTPRHGKPVELSALWYAGLMGVSNALEETSAVRSRSLRQLADHTARHFEKTFWNDAQQCLFDLAPGEPGVHGHEAACVRPNQVFATCLPESALSKAKRVMVLERVHEQLLTPFGLRTLAPGSSGYRPFYEGPLFARDGAYHCGTVWPWLLGPYCEGLMRVNNFSHASRSQARGLLQPLIAELMGDVATPADKRTGTAASSGASTLRAAAHEQQIRLRVPVRSLAEVYDADDVPELGRRRAEGCFAQAWSIAETLRVIKMVGGSE